MTRSMGFLVLSLCFASDVAHAGGVDDEIQKHAQALGALGAGPVTATDERGAHGRLGGPLVGDGVDRVTLTFEDDLQRMGPRSQASLLGRLETWEDVFRACASTDGSGASTQRVELRLTVHQDGSIQQARARALDARFEATARCVARELAHPEKRFEKSEGGSTVAGVTLRLQVGPENP